MCPDERARCYYRSVFVCDDILTVHTNVWEAHILYRSRVIGQLFMEDERGLNRLKTRMSWTVSIRVPREWAKVALCYLFGVEEHPWSAEIAFIGVGVDYCPLASGVDVLHVGGLSDSVSWSRWCVLQGLTLTKCVDDFTSALYSWGARLSGVILL